MNHLSLGQFNQVPELRLEEVRQAVRSEIDKRIPTRSEAFWTSLGISLVGGLIMTWVFTRR